MQTRLVRSFMFAAGLVALGACESDASRIEQLRKDLMLANGGYPYQPYTTPLEQGYGNAPGYQPQPNRNGTYTPTSDARGTGRSTGAGVREHDRPRPSNARREEHEA